MSVPQVLYEAKLANEGRKRALTVLVVMALLTAVGMAIYFYSDSFLDNIGPFAICVLVAAILSIDLRRYMRLWKNAGVYRIFIDDYGLYVHSDDPDSAPSFSVIATDLGCLVHKTIEDSDSGDDHEYYVGSKSGKRYQIEPLFARHDFDVMELFDKITDRFPWVEILEEVEP